MHSIRSTVFQEGTISDHLDEHHAPQVFDHLRNKLVQAAALQQQVMNQLQPRGYIFGCQSINKCGHGCGGDTAQQLLHLFQGDGGAVLRRRGCAVTGHLIEQADRIPHAALRAASNCENGSFLNLEALLCGDMRQVCCDFGNRDTAEIKALAAAENGCGNAVGFGSR